MAYRAPEAPGQCRVCAGPCGTYKGSVHGWTCADCLAVRLADQAARADARARAALEKATAKTATCWDNAPSKSKRSILV